MTLPKGNPENHTSRAAYSGHSNFSRFKAYSADSDESKLAESSLKVNLVFDKRRRQLHAAELLYRLQQSDEQLLFELNCENYIRLFDYKRRSKLEQALLIYTCHVKYLAARFEFEVGDLITNPYSSNTSIITSLFDLVRKALHINSRPAKSDVIKTIPIVEQQLADLNLERLPLEFYSFKYKQGA